MVYLLEIAAFQLLFLVLYYILKNETFFNYNRVYLLVTSCLSYVLPFVTLDIFSNNSVPNYLVNELPTLFLNGNTENTETIKMTASPMFSLHWWYVPVLGSLIMLTMFITKLWKLYRLTKTENSIHQNAITIILLKNSNTAFSFFSWIFMGELLKEEEQKIILEHEIIHVKQKHSIDLLFFEMQRILCWFNPLVYIYQNEIKAVHEFIVDRQMIQKTGANIYCKNLLTQLFNTPKFTFVNTFYKQSIIKKRIAMITKKESKTRATLKYAFIAPVIMGMLFYTSCKSHKKVIEEDVVNQSSTIKTEIVKVIEDVPFAAVQNPAVFPGCEEAGDLKKCFSDKTNRFISKNFDIGLTEELGLVGVQRMAGMFKIDTDGKVTDIKVRGEHEELNDEFKRVLNSLPQMTAATQNGEKVNMLFSLPLVFRVAEKVKEE